MTDDDGPVFWLTNTPSTLGRLVVCAATCAVCSLGLAGGGMMSVLMLWLWCTGGCCGCLFLSWIWFPVSLLSLRVDGC